VIDEHPSSTIIQASQQVFKKTISEDWV